MSLRIFACLILALAPLLLHAETKYVDDTLFLGFYKNANGSGGQFTSAPSGTRLTVIESREEYSLVKTEKGTEGWVKTKYLVDTPPAVVRIKPLEEAAARADALALEVEALTEENNYLRKEIDTLLLQPVIDEAEADTNNDEISLALTAQNVARKKQIEVLEAAIADALQALQSTNPAPAEIVQVSAASDQADPPEESNETKQLLNLTGDGKPLMAWKKILEILRGTSLVHYSLIGAACFFGFILGIFVLDRRIRSKHGGYRIW